MQSVAPTEFWFTLQQTLNIWYHTQIPKLMCLMSLSVSRTPLSSLSALKKVTFRNLSSENNTVRHMQNPTQPLESHLHFATSFQPTSRWSREFIFLLSLIVKIPLVFVNGTETDGSQVPIVFFARTGLHL